VSLLRPTWSSDGDWQHLRLDLPGPLLIDAIPPEPLANAVLYRMARELLQSMLVLHGQGLCIGGDLGAHVVLSPVGCQLIWLDRFLPSGSVSDDLADLGGLLSALVEDGLLKEELAGWAECPPPDAEGALHLLEQMILSIKMDSYLSFQRVQVKERRQRDRDALQRLAAALRDVAPPQGVFCLQFGTPPVVVHSDINGIYVEDELPIYDAENGLEPRKSRQLIRAWNTRSVGDERERMVVQDALGPFNPEVLVRWMVARGQLRRSLLLLQYP